VRRSARENATEITSLEQLKVIAAMQGREVIRLGRGGE
jgi:hypothetical protein